MSVICKAAGASHDVGDMQGVRLTEVDLHEASIQIVESTGGDEAQHQILLVRGANGTVAELARQRRHAAQLLCADIADRQLDGDHRVASLHLPQRVGPLPPRKTAIAERFVPVRRRGRGLCKRRDQHPQAVAEVSSALCLDHLVLLVETAEKLLLAELAEQELHPVLLAVLALAVAVIDAHDRLCSDEHVILRDEGPPQVRDLGRRSEPPRHVELEAEPRIGHRGEQADVVDHHLRLVPRAAR
jgi:hypothetical protein